MTPPHVPQPLHPPPRSPRIALPIHHPHRTLPRRKEARSQLLLRQRSRRIRQSIEDHVRGPLGQKGSQQRVDQLVVDRLDDRIGFFQYLLDRGGSGEGIVEGMAVGAEKGLDATDEGHGESGEGDFGHVEFAEVGVDDHAAVEEVGFVEDGLEGGHGSYGVGDEGHFGWGWWWGWCVGIGVVARVIMMMMMMMIDDDDDDFFERPTFCGRLFLSPVHEIVD
mmetsp:Transcript_7569/g.16551  ORF Transcript_7569/g.16551 Transcript_7569/m.16551 type:complete len:221 (-) Transcript_7569:89-751(-)